MRGVRATVDAGRAWRDQHRALLKVLLGAFWTATSIIVLVLCVLVWRQTINEGHRHHTESVTTKAACVRSRTFGPPFLTFLRETEAKLHIDPLNRKLEVAGHQVSVLDFYHSTIPRHCPK